MKKYIYLSLLLVGSMITVSCEKDVEVYSSADCYLNFYLDDESSATVLPETNFSFVYSGDVTQDTVWLKMTTLGFVSDVVRPIKLVQVATGENDAVPGTHYEKFDTGELQKLHAVPAGMAEVEIPIVMIRDASLKSRTVTLKLAIAENEYFKAGLENKQHWSVNITDMLSKPENWESYYFDYEFAIYTKGVHQFMIDITGEKWDEEYLDNINTDSGYVDYLAAWAKSELKKVNEERESKGLGVLMEDDGVTPVEFKTKSRY